MSHHNPFRVLDNLRDGQELEKTLNRWTTECWEIWEVFGPAYLRPSFTVIARHKPVTCREDHDCTPILQPIHEDTEPF